jgi:hypothetical protein
MLRKWGIRTLRESNVNNLQKKRRLQHPLGFVMVFFVICFTARIVDSLFIRTDQGVIGELFVHKLFGIVLMGIALYFLEIKWSDIGFNRDRFVKGLLVGLGLGVPTYGIAYLVECIAMEIKGVSPQIQFYTTSYNVLGNTELQTGIAFVFICIVGNIINVVMEDGMFRGLFLNIAEKRVSFIKAMIFSSVLFGIWHGIMPLRNFLLKEQSAGGALMNAFMLIITSFIFGVVLCLLCKVEGSLWAGMSVHFINNASVNLLHIVTSSGADVMQTMRITIAQVVLTVIVIMWYIVKKKKQGKNNQEVLGCIGS